jgi:hypothetical protein
MRGVNPGLNPGLTSGDVGPGFPNTVDLIDRKSTLEELLSVPHIKIKCSATHLTYSGRKGN